jgi:hypothetical protein
MMKNLVEKYGWMLLVLTLLLGSCESQPSLPPDRQSAVLDTAYVQVTPPFSGFDGPEDILIGRDQLLYVADTRANRLVMLNRAGQVMSERRMLHPRSLGQDTRLDLIVGGELVAPSGDTVAAVFRLHLVSASPDSAHRLEVAPMETVWVELSRPARRFPGVAVLTENDYLVVRSGPDNSSFVDPDARVLLFNKNDAFITPLLPPTTRVGRGITDMNVPTGITSFVGTRNFIVIQSSEGVAYGAIWLTYLRNADFDGWLPRFDPARPGDRSVDFILPDRYSLPQGVTIDRARGDIFVADAALDSVFKFNSRGRFLNESFGRVRSLGSMKRPTGLAFFEKILYVLDGETGKVLRFRLSTDVPR